MDRRYATKRGRERDGASFAERVNQRSVDGIDCHQCGATGKQDSRIVSFVARPVTDAASRYSTGLTVCAGRRKRPDQLAAGTIECDDPSACRGVNDAVNRKRHGR